MDHSITAITPAMQRERGAQAFDEGRGIDEHHMNPWVPAVADWQKGWRERQAQAGADLVLAQAMAMGWPP